MAMEKRHLEILERLDKIEAALKNPTAPKTAVKVTKAQLMKVKGVTSAAADEILNLLK
jgi:hypothetical protein